VVDDGKMELQLSLWPVDDELYTDVWDIDYVIRDGCTLSWQDVDLKIAREFVAVMTCGASPDDTDMFILVDWKAEGAYGVSKAAVAVLRPYFVKFRDRIDSHLLRF
jgi:hypothetical protein